MPTATPTVLSQLRRVENWLWLEQEDPNLAATVAELDWVRDGVDARESTVIQNLLYIAVISRPAASSLVDQDWIRDGTSDMEARAIDEMGYIEDADVLTSITALDWVQDGIGIGEVGAIEDLSIISNEDAQAGLSLLFLAWVVDGLDEPESGAINVITDSFNPKFSPEMIGFDWVQDGIEQGEVEALQYLSYLARQDAPLALSLATLGWIRDGLDDLERAALDWIGDFDSQKVTSSVIALPWVQDGIGTGEVEAIELLSHVANDDPAVGLTLAGLGWVQDGLRDHETDAIGWIGFFVRPKMASLVVAMDWVRDGIDGAEVDAIELLSRLENHDATFGLELLGLGWVKDGLDPVEADALKGIGNFASSKIASSLVTLDWVHDGIDEAEVDALEFLSRVESRDAAIGLALADLGWIRDGIDDLETDAIDWLGNFTSQEIASSIAALNWFQDDINDTERKAIEYLSYITNKDPATGRSLAAFSWVQDGIRAIEADAIRWISNFTSQEIASSIAALNWFQDDINDAERKAIEYLSYITNKDPATGRSLAAFSWVQDGIRAIEADAIRWISNIQGSEATLSVMALEWMADDVTSLEVRLIEEVSYLTYGHPQQALEIVGMPFLESVEPPDLSAVDALSDLSNFRPEAFQAIMSHPTIRGGITDDMTPVVATLDGVVQTNRDLVNVLLEPVTTVERRTVTLPLSGQVVLSIIRTKPGSARSMDLLEQSVRSVEAYMKLPLPTSYVGLLYEDAVYDDFAGVNFDTSIAIRPEYDVDDDSHEAEFAGTITAHEVAHYYWSGNEDWIDEGAANFMASVIEGALTGRPVAVANPPCGHTNSIAELEILGASRDDPGFRCNYSLGERLFVELHRTLGDERFRNGFRDLYLASEIEDDADDLRGTSVGIEHIREAFRSEDETESIVIARWYDGTEPYDLSGLDSGPVDPSLSSINGRIDEAYIVADTDGPAISDFSAQDITDWVYLTLKYSYRVSGDAREVPLEIVEYYWDGFDFSRRSGKLTAEARYIGGTSWWSVGLPPTRKWAPGRYWVYVYAGERKVAEVQYEVTP